MSMKDRKSKLAAFLGLAYSLNAGASAMERSGRKQKPPTPDKKRNDGVRAFYFDNTGNPYTQSTEFMVFCCDARNEKNAIRKFNNWLKRETNETNNNRG